ncbi:MAG TPA: sigma 54-interacting transcriptional regulator [Methylomirabilota bacterium]|jgi:DNA-binding NtrC family response regulator/tetratricopeptide (TPR) repeat protein
MILLPELVGESGGIVAVRERIARLVARASDVRRLPPVLIQGETGSGKGLVARALHRAGPRSGGPFVDVNCAAIPETLLEAEMFGFERGAFTDARQAKRGLFQTAHRGTLFLDEIGLLPDGLQAKLLTVLEERTVRRLGATRSEPVDVWIIAATNLDLQAATRAGRFREDLYHRLAVLTLALPPLRERRGDILLLAEHFLARACADYGLPAKTLAPDARAALVAHRWPGNVRELINTMERVALLGETPVVTADLLDLPEPEPSSGPTDAASEGATGPAPATLAAVVDGAERAHLQEALEATGWNVTRAAARLGISRNTIRYRIEKHGLRPGAPAPPRRPRQAPSPPASPPSPAAGAPAVGVPGRAGIRWERRRLAVLLATIASARDAGPLDTGRVIEALVEKARSFGGRVEELGASGFVALFGLEPIENPVRRAALAAVAMQRAAERTSDGGPGPGLRIAVDLGSFLLGRLSDASLVDAEDKRAVLGAVDALVQSAEPGTVVVSSAGAPFLARGFDLFPIGAAPGRRAAFRLGAIERGEAAGGRRPRFVGRDHELDLLRGRLTATVRGQGQVVAIAGEAGIGKSRLVGELRRGLSDQGILCLEGHCLPYATPIPCLPLVELLRAACAIVETDGPDGIRDKLRATLDRAGMDAPAATPYLLHLLEPDEGGDPLARLSPEVVKARTFETLRELSQRLAGRAPLVIVMEDLHWIDRTSEEYLGTLVDVVAGVRILLVTTHRPGYRPPWMDKSYATQVALQPLSPRESLSLARDVIGPAEVDEPTVEMIVAKAEGNPFFTEELARAVAEGGGPSPGSAVPDTVEGVLMARIDRLAAEDKRVLQAAAVIGRTLPFLLLQAILEPADETLRERLARLQGAEFLYETRAASGLEYTFKHALTHEVAYASLLPAQRQALHARIVDVLESWQREGREELVERLAHHAIQAEAWDKAVDYARRAGRQALTRSALRDAAAWFDQAVAALGHLPETRELVQLAIDLQFDLRNALWPQAEFRRVLDCLKRAEHLATTLGDQRRLAMTFALLTPMFSTREEHAKGVEYGRRALDLGAALGDLTVQVVATLYLAMAYLTLGNYTRATKFARKNMAFLEGEVRLERFGPHGLHAEPAILPRALLLWSLAELGEFAQAEPILEESWRIAERINHAYSQTFLSFGEGILRLRQGDLRRAVGTLERSLALCRQWKLAALFDVIAGHLGAAYTLTGRASEAIPLLEEALERGHRHWLEPVPSLALAEAYLRVDRAEDAIRQAERALDQARQRGQRGHEAWLRRLFGEITAAGAAGGAPAVADHYRQALALATELGMRPLAAHCHLDLGQWHRRAGDHAKAQEHMERARALYREMNMTLWLAQVEAEQPAPA